MKTLLASWLVAVAVAAPAAALAQTTGMIAGHVYDASGTPIRGVRVVASSEVQIGGPQSATTDDHGYYRIPGLSPGRFTLTASAPKLQSTVLTGIRVVQGVTSEVDIVLEVETAEAQVKVVERAPVIDTARASVGTTFDTDFVNDLPLASRDYQGVIALTPGVTGTGVGGNPSIRGGAYFQNSYTIDGFQTTDPVTHTFGTNFSFNAMASVDVQTAAYGAENSSTAGGISNIVTKSGSNRLQIEGEARYASPQLQFFKDARDTGEFREIIASLDVGGPIAKDRLWFYVSGQFKNQVFGLPAEPGFPRHPPESMLRFDGLGKLTWQLSSRNKLELLSVLSPGDFQNLAGSFLVEPEAESRARQLTRILGLSWQALLSDDFVLVLRSGVREIKLYAEPQSCKWDPDNCELVAQEIDRLSGFTRKNHGIILRDFRRSFELSGNLDWFHNSKRLGNHVVKLGGRLEQHWNPSAITVPGDAVFIQAGTQPFAIQQTCANDPKASNGECRTGWLETSVFGRAAHVFLQDAWKPTRHLTIIPGLALHQGFSSDDQQRIVTDVWAPTPHLQAIWDPTHDGRTKLFASFASLVDTGFLALARFTSRDLYTKQCQWDPDAKAYVRNCRSFGGNDATTLGLPCGPSGLNPDGTSCKTKLRSPRVWEYVGGGEREILTGVAAGATLVYRRFVHQWEDIETNAIWNQGGTGLRREANWKTGRAQYVFDLETPDQAYRRYLSVTAGLRKRQGRLRTEAFYTWTSYEGATDSSYAGSFLDNPGQTPYFYGPLPGDLRHDVRLLGAYQINPWLSAGVSYFFLSGAPYNRFLFDPAYSQFSAFGTRRGYDTQGTIDPDDDTALRLPDRSLLHTQVRVSLKRLVKQPLSVYANLYNILALRTTTAVVQQDGQFFGRPISRLGPMSADIGVVYRLGF